MPALAFPPPSNFVFRFAKCAAKEDVALDPPNPFAGNDKELPKMYNPILGLYHIRIYTTNSMSKSVYTKDYKEIINRLKQARIEIGLSQQAVADKLGKPQSYISKIESGERRLDVAEMKKFSEIYRKSVDYFLK